MKIQSKCIIEAAATTDQTRAVLLEPYLDMTDAGKPVMIATNGRIMAIVPVETEEGDVTGPVNKLALKAARKLGKVTAQLSCNGVCKMTDGSTMPRNGKFPEGGKYPNWRQIIPAANGDVVRVSFNMDYLASLAKALGTKGVILELMLNGDVSDGYNAIVVKPTSCEGTEPANLDAYGIFKAMRIS